MRRAHVGGPQCKTWDSTSGDEARTRNPFFCLPSVPVGATLGESVVGFQDFGCDILLQDGQEAFPVEDVPGTPNFELQKQQKGMIKRPQQLPRVVGSWFDSTGCFMNSLSLDNKENNTHIQSNKNPVYIIYIYILLIHWHRNVRPLLTIIPYKPLRKTPSWPVIVIRHAAAIVDVANHEQQCVPRDGSIQFLGGNRGVLSTDITSDWDHSPWGMGYPLVI